jgi:soluble cytochrome b562
MVSSQSKLREMEGRLESLEETVNVLADRKLLLSIRKSLAEIKQGKYKDYRSVREFREAFETHS